MKTLKLASRKIQSLGKTTVSKYISRLTENPDLPLPIRSQEVLLIKRPITNELPQGFRSYFILNNSELKNVSVENCFKLDSELNYLTEGDIVRFDPERNSLRTIYRRNSNFNSLLVTERCNSYCLMCSQPPKNRDDSYIVDELLEAIPLMSRQTLELGITGGEPTLLGDDLIKILRNIKNYLPNTTVHVLTNGRRFSDTDFTLNIANINHPDLMFGIPLYSDISNLHDYVVQAQGAYDETIKGILNLKRLEQKVEIRVVLHKQTYQRLPQLADFIVRNLLFVDHVALMGLEMMGFTKPNLSTLWIDPTEYQNELVEAVMILSRFKMRVSIYNHQLCLLDPRLYEFNRKSISDWKNVYMPECEDCIRKDECGGFFSSATFKYSDKIKPFVKHLNDKPTLRMP